MNNKIKDLINQVPPTYRNYPKYVKEPSSFSQQRPESNISSSLVLP